MNTFIRLCGGDKPLQTHARKGDKMAKTEFTKTELEELLANEPDTKLKKKLLAHARRGA